MLRRSLPEEAMIVSRLPVRALPRCEEDLNTGRSPAVISTTASTADLARLPFPAYPAHPLAGPKHEAPPRST